MQRIVSRDQVVGTYLAPWGSKANIVAASDLDLALLPGTGVGTVLMARALTAPQTSGTAVGSLKVKTDNDEAQVSVMLSDEVQGASRLWRLTRLV